MTVDVWVVTSKELFLSALLPEPKISPGRAWLQPLLTPWTRRAALLVFAGSFVFPGSGLGVDLCPIHRFTGLPCPGCGMTRAVALFSQREFSLALGAHPFVIVIWPLLALLAVLACVPTSRVLVWEGRLDALEPTVSRAQRVLFAAFAGFGALRFIACWVLGQSFP